MYKQKSKHSPPPFAKWLLGKILWKTNRHAIIGDFDEFYYQVKTDKNRFTANLWYWLQILYSIPSLLKNSIF